MNFKKLTLAVVLSIGIISVGNIAKADETGGACPLNQPAQMNPCEPCQKEMPVPACPAPCAPKAVSACPIEGTCPNCAPDAKVIRRQAYAFPSIGGSSVVYPRGESIVQIGGEEEPIAVGTATASGLTAMSQYGGALTLMPNGSIGGGASPLYPVCPKQVTQGLQIQRCNIPGAQQVFQSAYNAPYMTGGAFPIAGACGTPGCCPTNPCDRCKKLQCPTGAAVPINPLNPCSPCGPCGSDALQGHPRTIQTSSGLQIQQTMLVPGAPLTGAACPVSNQFPDVNNNMLAGCDINSLACQGVLVGYPDRTYKPELPILRDEFAAAITSALELQNVPDFKQQIFKDVSTHHWANSAIDKAYNRGLMAGYPNDTFKPDNTVSRAEALSSMAKVLPCNSACDAQKIISSYSDASSVPGWAMMPIAQAINAGIIKDTPNCDQIRPNDSASRAEVASMLKNLRQTLALEPCTKPVTGAACPLQSQMVSKTLPVVKLKFEDIISARTSEIGDRFVAKTTEPINIDGNFYPEGSRVTGNVAEIIRPGLGKAGAIRVSFNQISYGSCKTTLPREVLSAIVVREKNPNIVGRVLAWPFTWTGKVAGIAGRTVGGAATVISNMTEGVLTNFGNGTNELFNGKFAAAGRSYLMSGQDVAMGVYDTARTGLSGVTGVLKESGDEIAYVVSPDGSRIAQINPREILSISFGCK